MHHGHRARFQRRNRVGAAKSQEKWKEEESDLLSGIDMVKGLSMAVFRGWEKRFWNMSGFTVCL